MYSHNLNNIGCRLNAADKDIAVEHVARKNYHTLLKRTRELPYNDSDIINKLLLMIGKRIQVFDSSYIFRRKKSAKSLYFWTMSALVVLEEKAYGSIRCACLGANKRVVFSPRILKPKWSASAKEQ